MKFSTKLTILFSGVGLVISLVLVYLVYTSNTRTLKTHIKDRLQNQAFHTMAKIDMMLFERRKDIKEIALDPVIRSRTSTPKQILERLMRHKNDFSNYVSLSFFNLDRVRIADTSEIDIGKQHLLTGYWPDIVQGKEVVVNISEAESQNTVIFHFASIVKDRTGAPFGVVVARLPVEYLYNIINQSVGIYNLEKDLEIYLVDGNGLLLYSNLDKKGELKEIQHDWDFVKKRQSSGLNTDAAIHTNPEDKTREEILAFAREQGYMDFKGEGWTLITDISTKVAFASARDLITKTMIILFATGIFAFIVVYFSSRKISRAIGEMSRAVTKIGKGDLAVRIESRTKDEIGVLAVAFNNMAVDLKEYRDKILAHSSELEIKVGERTAELGKELAERRLAEKALVEAKEKYQGIFDNAVEGVYQSTPEGRFITANPAMARILGYDSPEELIETIKDIKHQLYVNPDDRTIFRKFVDTLSSVKGFETQFYRKDGSTIWVSINTRTVKDTNRNVLFYEGFLEDITERKQAEEALKKYSEELDEKVKKRTKELEREKGYLEKLHNLLGDAVFSVKIPERAIEFANRSVESIFGYKPEEIIGQKTVIFYPDEEGYLDFGKKLNDAIEHGEDILHTEHALKRKNGEIFPAEITTTFFRENGENTKVVSIIRDITERNKAAEVLQEAKDMAEAANRAKSEFLANMSHELRTPLNAVIGFSQVILDGMAGPVTPEQKEYANDILESGRHLLSIISDILDLSRIEAGKEELEITEFPLEALIKESLMMFHEKSIKHNIKLTTDVAGDIGNIKADARKIKQVVLNLMSNAIKFTPDGGSVSVSARRVRSNAPHPPSEIITPPSPPLILRGGREGLRGDDGELIEISVADTGIGIKEEDMQRLFRPFVQLEKHLTKKYAGTGLGLTLCKKFVEMHEGRIWAESEFGKGSRFIFIIPVQQPS